MKFKELLLRRRTLMMALLLLLVGAMGLWGPLSKPSISADEKGGNPPKEKVRPITVSLAPVQLADIPVIQQAIGNVEALESVSIQPQISGQLTKIHFTQGAFVQKGQLLFELDARLQAATLSQLEALLSRSQALVRQAKANLTKATTLTAVAEANLKRDLAQKEFVALELARNKQLLDKDYLALQQYQLQQNNLQGAEATLVADRAALVNAKAQVQAEQAALQTAVASVNADLASLAAARVQLGFSKIYAPLSGKTGPILINAGNNVMANSSTLVNIKRLSPILVSFAVPEKELGPFQAALRSQGVPVTAEIKGEKPFQEVGRLNFVDNQVNKATGMVTLKASFDNRDGRLWPGLFVPVSARLGVQNQVLTVPAAAVQKGPTGDFVYLFVQERAQLVEVKVGRISLGTAVITQGLKSGQRVIVTGLQALSPDAPVKLAGKKPGPNTGKTADGTSDAKQSPNAGHKR